VNSYLLAGHIPNAEPIICPDANHGFLFQYPYAFASAVNRFLEIGRVSSEADGSGVRSGVVAA
jgi:hypothetical protein